MMSDVLGMSECEIEDIVGEGELLPIVNELLGKKLKIEASTTGKRSLPDRIEDAMKAAGVAIPEGRKPESARRLAAKWATADTGKVDAAMLDPAAKLFKALNERLS